MQNRLHIQYTVPPRYKKADFQDVISALINKTKLRVEDGYIKMGACRREREFEKFGKKFKIHIMALFGQVYIDIKEITSKDVPPLPPTT